MPITFGRITTRLNQLTKMQKKLTITLDEQVYEGLYNVVGTRKISQYIENLLRPLVLEAHLEAGYAAMAADEAREAEAIEWSEAFISDLNLDSNETW